MKLVNVIVLLTGCFVIPSHAVVMPPVPTEPIYFEPPIVTPSDNVKLLSCIDLDNSIRTLHPFKYSYKPDFYHDESNQIAATFVMYDSVPIVKGLFGLMYLGYSSLVEEKEQRRVLLVEQQISMLQQLKAEKHCFE
jgi:hypothetical protein